MYYKIKKYKILLVGDYSGAHLNLSKEFRKQGHDCKLIAKGDFWKNIDCDIKIKTKNRNFIINNVYQIFQYLFNIKYFIGNDVVQVINPNEFPKIFGIFFHLFIKIFNRKYFYYACGDDVTFIKHGAKLEYYPYSYSDKLPYKSFIDILTNYFFIKTIDGIIPSAFDYAFAYRASCVPRNKIKKTIALCINFEDNNLKFNDHKPLKILHSLNRENFKGTEFIVKALNKLVEKYPTEINFVVDGKIPFNQYLENLKKYDIIIDQCKSYFYGMNALLALSLGKIVLSGAEPIALKEIGADEKICPIINIKPSVDDIYYKLELLILRKINLQNIVNKNLVYIKKYHSCQKIVKEFLMIWGLTK